MSSPSVNGFGHPQHRHYHRQDLHHLEDEEDQEEEEECPLQSSPRPPERIESR